MKTTKRYSGRSHRRAGWLGDDAVTFDDLWLIRQGGASMTMGEGPTTVAPLSGLHQWQQKAEALRALYRWLHGRRPDQYDGPLDLRIDSEEDRGDHLKRAVSYVVGPGERVRAYILIPRGRPLPRPAVVTIHQTTKRGKEQTIGNDPTPHNQDYAYGLHLVQHGYVTISYDLDSANERQYPGCESFGNRPFYDKCPEWSARGKDIYDLSRAIDALIATPEVNASRIGSIGHSQGGGITTDAMALEPRIVAGVGNCGDWPFRLNKNPFNRCRSDWWIGNPQLRPFAACAKEIPIDLHEKLALAAPRPIMMIVALNDFQYTAEEESITRPAFENLAQNVRRVYNLYGVADHFQMVLHTLGHSFAEDQRAIAYAFLDRHLQPEAGPRPSSSDLRVVSRLRPADRTRRADSGLGAVVRSKPRPNTASHGTGSARP